MRLADDASVRCFSKVLCDFKDLSGWAGGTAKKAGSRVRVRCQSGFARVFFHRACVFEAEPEQRPIRYE